MFGVVPSVVTTVLEVPLPSLCRTRPASTVGSTYGAREIWTTHEHYAPGAVDRYFAFNIPARYSCAFQTNEDFNERAICSGFEYSIGPDDHFAIFHPIRHTIHPISRQ